MIKDNQKLLNQIHIILDGLIVIISCLLTYKLRYDSFLTRTFTLFYPEGYYYNSLIYLKMLIVLVPAYLLAYNSFNLYGNKPTEGRHFEIRGIIKANIIGIFVFTAVILLTKYTEYARIFLILFFMVNTLLDFLCRYGVSRILTFYRKKGFNLRHVLVVGYSRAAESFIDRLKANPEWGYSIYGILDDGKEIGTSYKDVPVIGSIDCLADVLDKNTLDEIAITLSINEYSKLESIVSMCEKSGVHTKFIPDYNNIVPTHPYTEDLNGLPVINIRRVPLTNLINKFVKRVVDIFGATIAILLFAIPMIIVSIIIKTTSKGPLIFPQVRIGLHNKEFKMYKFRSMEQQNAEKEKKAWTTINDPRVTPIGKLIRRTSIDELPQLFNVLKGDMSLIGPRPERPFFVEKFREEIPRYMIKHQVRPGITGWAQVNGFRGDTSIRKRIDHDLYYIENWTLSLDIRILFMTFFKGFVNKNAY